MPLDTHTPPKPVPVAPNPKSRKWLLLAGVVLLGGALLVAVLGVLKRQNADVALAHWTTRQAVPTVAVIAVQRGVSGQELVLPGDIEAFYQASIYARVDGYLKMWYQDIGAKVKAGQLLAEIDTPDLDQRLSRAKHDLASVQATQSLANLTAKRWEDLRKSDSVSQQNSDEKVGDAAAEHARAAAAQSNVDRLTALEGFKRIVAPFDGVVTARKTDIGALINAGSASGSELFSVADIHEMRVYVQVPQAFSAFLKAGMHATLKVAQFPDQPFDAKLLTTSNAISQETLSVLVQLTAANPNAKLWPGTFAEVHFDLPPDPSVMRLPTSALLFRDRGMEVATVGADDKVMLKPVTVGRDLGTEIEIKSGLADNDRVIDSPLDSLATGDVVIVKSDDPHAAPGAPARVASERSSTAVHTE